MTIESKTSWPPRLSDLHGDARRKALVQRHIAGEQRWADRPRAGLLARLRGAARG